MTGFAQLLGRLRPRVLAGHNDQSGPSGADAGPSSSPVEFEASLERRGRLRVRTLILLRWLAVTGQVAAVLFVTFYLGFQTPLALCLAVISASAWLNVFLMFAAPGRRLARDWEAAAQLCFDVVQLALLLGFTGGLMNPFMLVLIAPATVAAATLPTRHALLVALLAFAVTAALAIWSLPLPWYPGETLQLPKLYEAGMWAATVIGIAFTAGYAWQAALESSRMELALAATQSVLSREQRLSALGGLAAAAAHELGTPLATIQIVAKEMLRAAPEGSEQAEDAQLLLSQAARCREILRQLSQKPQATDAVHGRLSVQQLLDEAAEPYQDSGPMILTEVEGKPGLPVPDVWRLPEVIHALASWIENAADFAETQVVVTARFDEQFLTFEVRDDGAGFSPEVIVKLGEPYVTTRPSGEGSPSHHEGMGLGFFIAKTLFERSGGKVTFFNHRQGGAVVQVRWPRGRIEPKETAL